MMMCITVHPSLSFKPTFMHTDPNFCVSSPRKKKKRPVLMSKIKEDKYAGITKTEHNNHSVLRKVQASKI